jgi:hypothetical protein
LHSSENMAPPNSAGLLLRTTLDASVLNGPCVGVQAIAAFFAATSGGMYETIEFTHETTTGRKTYLEWQGTAFGKQVRGTTILTRNHEGLIEHIQLYHSPLQVVVEFARELAKRLEAESKSGCTE